MSTAIAQKPKFSAFMNTDGIKKLILGTLQDPNRAQRFSASILSAVAINPDLQKCDFNTILSGALLGESLDLSPSPQLGQFYLVPFEDKKNDRFVATFVLGYKGYKILAQRSGEYLQMPVVPVKKGELKSYNPFTGELDASPIEDPLEREVAETVGYYASFRLLNGYTESLYWSKEKMVNHAMRYSPAFGSAPAKGRFPGRVSYDKYLSGEYNKGDEWAYSSNWYKNFDAMAVKTMFRQLLSHGAPMSIQMRSAFEADDRVISPSLAPEYGGSEYELPPPSTRMLESGEDNTLAADGTTGEVVEQDEISFADL